jgi:excisionase family DNA binding protein
MLLTLPQAAARLQISTRQLRRLLARGLPSILVGKTARRIPADALEAWIREQTTWGNGATPQGAGTSNSSSAETEYIAAARRVRARPRPAPSKPACEVISLRSA